MNLRLLAVVVAALLAAVAGLMFSIGISDPRSLAGTTVGNWLGEKTAPTRAPLDVVSANEGDVIGDLGLTDLDGRPYALPAGRQVLVNVWASWCVPCRDEMPLFEHFAQSQGATGIVVVGIAEDYPVTVRDYLRQTPVNYPILFDDAQWRAGTRIGNRKGVLPFSALIDANGRLLRRQYGPFADAKALTDWASTPSQ